MSTIILIAGAAYFVGAIGTLMVLRTDWRSTTASAIHIAVLTLSLAWVTS